MSKILSIESLRVAKQQRVICDVPKLELVSGERLGIHGPNGCGKTTLLRVVAGLERDLTGKVIKAPPSGQVVLVHQTPWLFRGTVLSNVMYGLRAHGKPRAEARSFALQWLERLGISALADQRANSVSAGERRRVALARAACLRPALLLLDEPLAELDDVGAQGVVSILQDLKGTSVLIAAPQPAPEGLVDRQYAMTTPNAHASACRTLL